MTVVIDPKIRPLVDALNAIDGVTTHASCEGHFRRWSDPYVYFSCAAHIACSIAERLDHIRRQGNLHYWWELTGNFNHEFVLWFTLRSPSLAYKGEIVSFVNYVLRRQKIDSDISLLSEELRSIQQPCEVGRDQDDDSAHGNADTDSSGRPLLAGNLSDRVCCSALRTRSLYVGGNGTPADLALGQSGGGHDEIPPSDKYHSIIARLPCSSEVP